MSPSHRIAHIVRYPAFPKNWRALLERGQPFVVTEGGRCRLTIAHVAKLGVETEIIVKNQADGAVVRASLTQLVNCLGQDGAIWYMAQHPVPPCLDSLVPKNPTPGAPGLRKPNVWLGSARAHTSLHQDVLHNFILQLEGKKQWSVFAPNDDQYLARETLEERPNYSQHKLTAKVDRARYPEFRKARRFVVDLGPKDIFVLPAYWWHEVVTLEASLMLNYWWAPTLKSVRGIDVERLIYSPGVVRRHVLSHLDLSDLESDHALIDRLYRQKLSLLAAVLLGDLVDELIRSLAAKHQFDVRLYPETSEALLKTKGVLSRHVTDFLQLIRDDVAAAEVQLKNKSTSTSRGFKTVTLNHRLRALCATLRLQPCTRLIRNNALWMKNISADTYRY